MLMVSLLKHIYLSCYESLAYIQDFDRIILVELAKDHVQPGNDRGNFMNLYPKEREREDFFLNCFTTVAALFMKLFRAYQNISYLEV